LKILVENTGSTKWINASKLFRKSGWLIVELCKVAMKQDSEKCSELVTQIAENEEKAYHVLEDA
jgi:uncharacterized membrane protein